MASNQHDHAGHGPVDRISGQTTTGHSWDGISELNTPLPRWWLWTFYITIVWAIGYMILFPAIPLITTHTKGLLGYSSRAQVAEEIERLRATRMRTSAALETASLADIKANPDLLRIAMAQGRAAFGDNCAACHGSGGQGATGYPALVDDKWLWGGTLEDIQQTILHGIRWSPSKETRVGEMLAFGKTGVLKKDEIDILADHVRALSGLAPEKAANVEPAKKLFAENCAACHGDAGKGNPQLGAPNLTDNIWTFGGDKAAIVESITNGRAGVMPAWTGRLDATTVKALTVYVHSLGGGQ
jgi:cytochrome c oxidase cbb3-type subunit 3